MRVFIHIGVMLLYGLTALCVFLALLNRRLILIPDRRWKSLLILVIFVGLTGGIALAGLLMPILPWIWIPVGLLAVFGVGEIRRVLIRRACAGSPPVESTPCALSLGRPFTTTDLVCHRYQVTSDAWKGRPFRIVHLSDLHINAGLPLDYYRAVFTRADQMRADLVFITGDFISRLDGLPLLKQVLRPLGACGTFAVLGNHDYWAGASTVAAVVREAGITLLFNETIRIELDGVPLHITGWDHPWGRPSPGFPAVAGDAFQLVLSHTPDNIYRISRHAVAGVFSGHYHAGQIRIPHLGPIVVPSIYGRRFDHGHFVVQGTHLFVPSGIGASTPPLRIYCRPDLFVIDWFGTP